MGRLVDMAGKRFGRLTVIERVNSKCGHAYWRCQCDCGKYTIVDGSKLRRGVTQSCGCLVRECTQKMATTHGGRGTRLWQTWRSMRQRCNDLTYERYGGRGIKVCQEWDRNFVVFREWALSHGYRNDLTIDRINVDGDYTPENCRWANKKTQANNRGNNRLMTFQGKTLTVAQWAEWTGISRHMLYARLNRGWSIERAMAEAIHTEKIAKRK